MDGFNKEGNTRKGYRGITTTHRPRAVYPGEKEGDMIEKFFDGYTVFYQGDEIYFDTYEEAEQFIEEMEGQK